MGLFSGRKPKVVVGEFCRDFFGNTVLNPIVAGIDAGAVSREVVVKLISEVDPQFSKVDASAFERELTAVHFELFGLALAHQFRKRYEYWVAESVFTKRYLQEAGRLDLWEAGLAYSNATAGSVDRIPMGKRMRRFNVGMGNELKFAFLQKWMPVGVDPVCLGRAACRIWTEGYWSQGYIVPVLAETMLQRLPSQLGPQGTFRLSAVLFGFYTGAKAALESVDLSIA